MCGELQEDEPGRGPAESQGDEGEGSGIQQRVHCATKYKVTGRPEISRS